MTQEIKDKLAELRDAASNICYELWRLSEDNESLTETQIDIIQTCAIDADQLAINIKHL